MMDRKEQINELAFIASKLGSAFRSLDRKVMRDLMPNEHGLIGQALENIHEALHNLREEEKASRNEIQPL
jgi:cation transport regulator ChaC